MAENNPYDTLGVTADAENEVIDAVYESLVKKYHPDQGGNEEKFKQIKKAYEDIQENRKTPGHRTEDAPPGHDAGIGSFFDLFDTPVETEVVAGRLSDGLVLEGDQLTISLINIDSLDISDYVPKNWPSDTSTKNRLVVITHISNTSDYVQPVKAYDFRIIDQKGRRYDVDHMSGIGHAEADLTNETKELPSQLYSGKRKMEPNTTANFISVIEDVDDSIEIDRVIYPFKLFDGHQIDGVVKEKTRYVFDIKPHHWEQFELVANGRLAAPPEAEVKELNEATPDNSVVEQKSEHSGISGPQEQIDGQVSEQDAKRLADIIELEPTTNSELQNKWGLSSGSAVHEYLSSSLSTFYRRNDDNKIVATSSAKLFIDQITDSD